MAMTLRIDQLKSITLPGGLPSGFWQSISGKCAKVYSLYDILNSYISTIGINLYTDATLSGKGALDNKLKIAQQGATIGQALVWNGNTWLPGTVATSTQTLAYNPGVISLTSGGTINISEFVSSDSPNLLKIGTDSEFVVALYKDSTLTGNGTQASPLSIAQQSATSGQVLTWSGSAWAPASVSGSVVSGTSIGQILYWNGSGWVTAKQMTNTQTGLGTSVVTLPHLPISTLPIDVYLNGVLKEINQDYTQATNQVVFSIPIVSSDKITTKYYF